MQPARASDRAKTVAESSIAILPSLLSSNSHRFLPFLSPFETEFTALSVSSNLHRISIGKLSRIRWKNDRKRRIYLSENYRKFSILFGASPSDTEGSTGKGKRSRVEKPAQNRGSHFSGSIRHKDFYPIVVPPSLGNRIVVGKSEIASPYHFPRSTSTVPFFIDTNHWLFN